MDRGDLSSAGITQLVFEGAFCWGFFIGIGNYAIILKTRPSQTAC